MRLLLALSLCLMASASLASWSVPARIEVSGDEVRLSDLVRNGPPEWSRVALGRGPRPGGRLVWNREWILDRARQANVQGDLAVPDKVEVVRPGQVLDREAVAHAVESAVGPRLRSGESMSVTPSGVPAIIPEGEVAFSVAPLPQGELPPSFTLWMDVLAGGVKAGRAWARVEVGRFRPTLVLSRSARKGEVLTERDLEVRQTRSTRTAGLGDPSQAVGKRLLRSVSAGSALASSDVEAVPSVEKGDLVKLVARVGSVVATATGRALEAGAPQERLKVENLASRRVVQGVVRERGVVEVLAAAGGEDR
ncbi:MAG: flagellar basal body P-ring formation protein FlgA [Deltaproteobacteria bacterium]|nr:flagellar basal body P-ring formation protein FlgA [Deltaproteobacteria bacterium]